MIAAASGQALDTVSACLSFTQSEKLLPLIENLVPIALREDAAGSVVKLLKATAAAPASADDVKAGVISAIIAAKVAPPALDQDVTGSFTALLENPVTAPNILPLIAAWDKEGMLKEALGKQIAVISKTLADPKAKREDRIAAARTLVSIGTDDTVAPAFLILQDAQEPQELQAAIVEMIGASDFSVKMAMLFNELSPGIRIVAYDEIVKRPAAALEFLKGVEGGTVDPKNIGPGNVARLRSHPDKAVAARANALLDKLMPGAKQKAEIIAKFLPEVTKPGNAANGKAMYAAACAVCHKFGDVGKVEVGPTLTGMGSHGAAEMLVHIIDPNREVDPTYWQWNITTKKGETLAGVITTENNAALTLRNQGGDTEIRKEDIASRVNTQRSLMPEGLDGLGPENIRDILAYMKVTDSPPLETLPPDSTSATGQRFLEPRRTHESLRVLVVGAGSSHHFPRDFIAADVATLSKTGADVIGTMNLAEALEAMPKADVLVFSGNHAQWGTTEFQKALHDFADAGKGIVLIHAATWSHPWEGYNKRFVAGETKGHGKGNVAADCIRPANHSILKGVPETFTIADESYHSVFFKKEGQTTIIENKPDGKSPDPHPALWIVNDPKARIVCYTHGHDDKSHAHEAYQTILRNAVKWVSEK